MMKGQMGAFTSVRTFISKEISKAKVIVLYRLRFIL